MACNHHVNEYNPALIKVNANNFTLMEVNEHNLALMKVEEYKLANVSHLSLRSRESVPTRRRRSPAQAIATKFWNIGPY